MALLLPTGPSPRSGTPFPTSDEEVWQPQGTTRPTDEGPTYECT